METIEYNKKGHLLEVELNRPKAHNAMNAKMIEELTEVFQELAADPTIRLVYLSGNGPSFCAGADLHWMQDSIEFTQQQNLEDAKKLYDLFSAVKDCKAPVVTRVHGNVMGGAMGLVAASDIVYADLGSVFCFSEVKLGLVPAMISPFVKRKMTSASMHDLMLTARKFDVDEAKRVGLVTEKGREFELDEFIDKQVKAFMLLAPEAVLMTKKLLLDLDDMPAAKYKEYTSQLISEKRATPEGQEGLSAFFEKRSPSWVIAEPITEEDSSDE